MKVVSFFYMMTKREDRVKKEIKTIFRPNAEKPANIAKSHSSLYVKACKAFGSWRNAVEACGLDYESSRNNRKWTRDRILREIKRIGAGGGCLRPSILRKSGMTKLVSAAEYHFGSWRRAVEACGLEYSFGRRKKRMRLSA